MENIIDMIAMDSEPAKISDELKDLMYQKAAKRVEDLRPEIGNATVVRLVNNSATARLVTVIDSVGGSTTIGTFTLPGNTVELVEKKQTEAIFAANAAILGAKAGYTN